MKSQLQTTFGLNPSSWLARKLDEGRCQICTLKEALACECRPNKHEELRSDLRESLEAELGVITALPNGGFVIRCDQVEKLRASELRESPKPSVDICSGAGPELLLVECKYKALPETSIVKTISAFDYNVGRKFVATESFLRNEGASAISSQRIVLFNAESKDKVMSMFKRLPLEVDGDDSDLKSYLIMDTMEFHANFGNHFIVQEEAL